MNSALFLKINPAWPFFCCGINLVLTIASNQTSIYSQRFIAPSIPLLNALLGRDRCCESGHTALLHISPFTQKPGGNPEACENNYISHHVCRERPLNTDLWIFTVRWVKRFIFEFWENNLDTWVFSDYTVYWLITFSSFFSQVWSFKCFYVCFCNPP